MGCASGVLAALIAVELFPRLDADLVHYRRVRDFVRESFVQEVTDEELLEHALHGMLERLDAYSRYYDPSESAELERETVGRFVGIGAVFAPPAGAGRVLFAMPGSPAARAGVRVGDRIVSVDGRPLAELEEGELARLVGRSAGVPIELRVSGLDGEGRVLSVTPESLVDPTVRHARMVDREHRIGYVALSAFSHETLGELDRTFGHLRENGMRALVLDLRGNFGGVLEAAVRIAERFIAGGVIVSTEGRGEPVVLRSDPSEALWEGFPLVVLVDGDSASASEVLAGALQDHRAAVLCGTPTYGKGMVQTMRRFVDRGAVAKITTSYYYTPTHRNFERTLGREGDSGIRPDLAVPITDAERRAIHAFLARHGAPVEARADLEAWERAEGLELIEPHPPDAQLDAALELLRGRPLGALAGAEER